MSPIQMILTDIEGTTLPVRYVRETMFRYANDALPEILRQAQVEPEMRASIAQIAQSHPGADPLIQLRKWIKDDVKCAPLKTVQGFAWEQGFARGDLQVNLYPDAAIYLRHWHKLGRRLAVFSSGSQRAQRLIYRYTSDGDLAALFEAFFDLDVGSKKAARSYAEIAHRVASDPQNMLFLSDDGAEIAAARAAGYLVCQILRAQESTQSLAGVEQAQDFEQVAHLFNLDPK